METESISVVVGTLGLIKKGLDKVTCRIPGNISTNEIQKITILGTTSPHTKESTVAEVTSSPITLQVYCLDPATMDGKQENLMRTSLSSSSSSS